MDTQTFVNVIFGGIITLLGTFGKIIYTNMEENIKTIQKEVHELDVLVAGDYVKREEFNKNMSEIFNLLREISGKLESKENRK